MQESVTARDPHPSSPHTHARALATVEQTAKSTTNGTFGQSAILLRFSRVHARLQNMVYALEIRRVQ
jgi:hypothetical protein